MPVIPNWGGKARSTAQALCPVTVAEAGSPQRLSETMSQKGSCRTTEKEN